MAKIWLLNAVFIIIVSVLLLLAPVDTGTHIALEAAILLAFLIMILSTREPVSVTISGIDGTFTYRTMNCFGRMKDKKVLLNNAKISYKYTLIHRYTRGWQLSLYNNYFRNRITIMEEQANGYNMNQMDRMVEVINKIIGAIDD